MVYRVFSAFLRHILHFMGRIMRRILSKIMKIYSDFGGRLIHADMQYLDV